MCDNKCYFSDNGVTLPVASVAKPELIPFVHEDCNLKCLHPVLLCTVCFQALYYNCIHKLEGRVKI